MYSRHEVPKNEFEKKKSLQEISKTVLKDTQSENEDCGSTWLLSY
jgi:hypothetical protein